MTAYYNENNPYAAQWLRNLIEADLIAPGDVDERSIKDVRSNDLREYTQCHFFAGIGGWSYALRLALWPDDRPVWTGSCPCQPFSAAGRHKGANDERHLWPYWFDLIRECSPSTIFGEQTERAITFGWLDQVQNDLEGIDYAFAPVNMAACAFGAPHERERLWFVADATDIRCKENKSFGGLASESQENRRLLQSKRNHFWMGKSPLHGLDDGLPDHVDAITAAANAIVPQAAQAFIEAFMEVRP